MSIITSSVDPFAGRQQRVIPGFIVHDAKSAIEFYKNVFDAQVKTISYLDDKIPHAEIIIYGSSLMLSDEMYGPKMRSAKAIGDNPVAFYVYVTDVQQIVDLAVKFGAHVTEPIQDMFYGDRIASFTDPFGIKWTVAQHIKDVSDEESKKGLAKMMSEKQKGGFDNDLYLHKYLKYKKKYQDLSKINKSRKS
jgi:PhnB protein